MLHAEMTFSAGWWQLTYVFMFTPKIGEDETILISILFKGAETTGIVGRIYPI